MEEKAYKVMNGAGAGSIALGIIMLVAGVVCGVLSIINGARLNHHKSDIIF